MGRDVISAAFSFAVLTECAIRLPPQYRTCYYLLKVILGKNKDGEDTLFLTILSFLNITRSNEAAVARVSLYRQEWVGGR